MTAMSAQALCEAFGMLVQNFVDLKLGDRNITFQPADFFGLAEKHCISHNQVLDFLKEL